MGATHSDSQPDFSITTLGVDENTTNLPDEKLSENYSKIVDAVHALERHSDEGDSFTSALYVLLVSGRWKAFKARNNRIYTHAYFGDFLVAKEPAGLGTTLERARALARGDARTERLLEEALMREPGDWSTSPTTLNNVQGSSAPTQPPAGNSRAATIRQITRLARDASHPQAVEAEQLLEKVYAKQISANAAAIQLGLRKKVENLNLTRLSDEVQQRIQQLRDDAGWTPAEVIEEALRVFFRALDAEDSEDESPADTEALNAPAPPPVVPSTAGPTSRNGHSPPESAPPPPPADTPIDAKRKPAPGHLYGAEVARICGVDANALSTKAANCQKKGKDLEQATPDGSRRFIRRAGEPHWQEITP